MVKWWTLWWIGGKYGRLLQLTIFRAILLVAVLLLSGCENYFLTLPTFALLMSLFSYIENDRKNQIQMTGSDVRCHEEQGTISALWGARYRQVGWKGIC